MDLYIELYTEHILHARYRFSNAYIMRMNYRRGDFHTVTLSIHCCTLSNKFPNFDRMQYIQNGRTPSRATEWEIERMKWAIELCTHIQHKSFLLAMQFVFCLIYWNSSEASLGRNKFQRNENFTAFSVFNQSQWLRVFPQAILFIIPKE